MNKLTLLLISFLVSIGINAQDIGITGFTLVNAITNEDIIDISEDTEINLLDYVGVEFNIRANSAGEVKSVGLQLNGPLSRTTTENVAPYALFGDSPAGEYRGQSFSIGTYTISATPFSEASANGIGGQPLSVNFKMVEIPLQKPFITTWKTDNPGVSADNQITIFIDKENGFFYNFDVDWGDGQITHNVTSDIAHTYDVPGIYQISISGDFPSIRANNQLGFDKGDAQKIISINQWGDIEWLSMQQAFEFGSQLEVLALDVPDLTQVSNVSAMFGGCILMRGNRSFKDWDVSRITDMTAMFASSGINQDISNWDVSNVETMHGMFSSTPNFNQDISRWNVSSARNIRSMFARASSFDQDLGPWDISNVSQMNDLFDGITLSIANYDSMLQAWSSQQLQTGVNFDGGNSQYCLGEPARQKLIDDFDWVITDAGKAEDCVSKQRPFITTWKTDNQGKSDDNQITITTDPSWTYQYDIDWGDGTSDEGISGDIIHTYALAGVYKVSISGVFPSMVQSKGFRTEIIDAEKLLSVNQWGDIEWRSMLNAFRGCENVDLLAEDIPNLSHVRSMTRMFLDCTSLVGNPTMNLWNVSTVTDMSNMFNGATRFNQDISAWNVSKVTGMTGMFARTDMFNQNIGSWNVGNVIFMESMFGEAKSFNQDIGDWDVGKVTNLNFTFRGADAFNQDIGHWNVSNVEIMPGMFFKAGAFDQDLGDWDISKVTTMQSMFFETGLSSDNYDNTLIGWQMLEADETQVPTGIEFNGGNSKFCMSEVARNKLIHDLGWTINDGGRTEDCLSVEIEADLLGATFLQGLKNLEPDGPLLRVEEGRRESYLKFDLSGLNGELQIARLEMLVSGDPGNGTVQVFLGSHSNWTEQGLNGGNKPLTVGDPLASISGGYSLRQKKVWNLDIERLSSTSEGLLTLIVKHSNGNDVAFASDETTQSPKLFLTSSTVPQVQRPFITTWKTNNYRGEGNRPVIIPTFDGEAYDYTVDWGDGTSDTGVNGDIAHVYDFPGIYQVSISGSFPRIDYSRFRPGNAYLTSVDQWGDIEWSSMKYAFAHSNVDVKATDVPDLGKVEDVEGMFLFCPAMTGNESFSEWDTSNVKNMANTFAFTNFNVDIGDWDTSNVETMAAMFIDTPFNQNISDWNVTEVTDMIQMFSETPFNQDISDWDVSSVVRMHSMFAYSDFNQDISTWNVESVTDMVEMFYRTNLSVENYDNILIGWSAQQLQNGVVFGGGESQYCLGEVARQKLINDFGWTITDGGKLEDCNPIVADESDLIEATYLQGHSNPEPNGPILRVEEGKRETYLKFDLSNFSGGIAEARLEMQVASDPGYGTIEVFLGNDSNWTEAGLNGGNKPTTVGSSLGVINGTHLLGQTKTWNLNASRLSVGGELTLIVKHSNGNDVAFASDETANPPRLFLTTIDVVEAGAILGGTLSLSPNPAVNDVKISFESPGGKKLSNDIRIYDTIGRLVRTISANEIDSKGDLELNVRGLESGIYFIKTYDNSGIPYQKPMVIKK